MLFKILLTVSATLLGVVLVNLPLRKYQFFNLIMDFFAAGGLG